MERNIKDKFNGWDISLQRNIHMYAHDLKVEKGPHKFSIACEDLPIEPKTIGVWLHSASIPKNMMKELQQTLLQWANKIDARFQIYTNKNVFITNKSA